MRDGFVSVASATNPIKVANPAFNSEQTIKIIKEANTKGALIVLLPELGLSGATCNDYFRDSTLIEQSKIALKKVVDATNDLEIISVVGTPLLVEGKLYNCSVVISKGEVLAVVAKKNLTLQQRRYFSTIDENIIIELFDFSVPFGSDLIFISDKINELSFKIEIGQLTSLDHQSANLILNPASEISYVGKEDKDLEFARVLSSNNLGAFVKTTSSKDESTSDYVYASTNIISELGKILVSEKSYEKNLIISEIDFKRIQSERIKNPLFNKKEGQLTIIFDHKVSETKLTRNFSTTPFVPSNVDKRVKEALSLQVLGLAKRIEHLNSKNVVLGISGGLDSTLALIVAYETFKFLKLDVKGIIAITMPSYGTTKRTYFNAVELANLLGVSFKEIDITKAVEQHFKDIGHDPSVSDVVYENSQARERTQILMDIANKEGAFVIGTGDLSELALGWATYNGDQMSNYAVNSSIPKTLISHIIKYFGKQTNNEKIVKILDDICATPVSPELLPLKDEKLVQITEEVVGPYILHDFFIYHYLKYGATSKKILRLATYAFKGMYNEKEIANALKNFFKRFVSSQFKRSSFPDGLSVGTISLNAKDALQLPSDADLTMWVDLLD